MNVDSLKWIYNETDNCVIKRIFSGNDEQKLYLKNFFPKYFEDKQELHGEDPC